MATMLDCKTIQNELSEYVDGTLSGDRSWTIKMHVSSCAVCDRIARDFTQTAQILASLPQAEPSANFEAALARRLADGAFAPPRPASAWGRMTGSVASLWNTAPRLRPLMLAPGLALAALIPVAFFVGHHDAPQGFPAAQTQAATGKDAKDTTLDDLLSDHVAYASSEPLGDPSGMLSAQSVGDRTL